MSTKKLYLAKLSLKSEDAIDISRYTTSERFVVNRLDLQEILKKLLQAERK